MRVPKRFRQFSLATLLVLMTIAAAYFGYVAAKQRLLKSLSGDWRVVYYVKDGTAFPQPITMRVFGDEATLAIDNSQVADLYVEVVPDWRLNQIEILDRRTGIRNRLRVDGDKLVQIGKFPDPNVRAVALVRAD